jgi:ubiquitin-protein ligase
MQNARDIRLQSDYAHLRSLATGSGGTLLIEQTKGRPPDQYILVYKCRTIERLDNGKPIFRNVNRVEIKLPVKYPAPFDAPKVRMLTPVWHPHVYKNLVVCMGDWTTSEYLDVFALRLGALLQFEKEFFDIRDPANEEAIDWARRNLLLFPTDTCNFRGDPPDRFAAPVEFASLIALPTVPAEKSATLSVEHYPALPSDDVEAILWEDLT